MDCHRDIGVELGDSWGGDLGAGLADILRLEEELGGEICDGDGCGIVKSKGLDTSEGDILGYKGEERSVNQMSAGLLLILPKYSMTCRYCLPISTPRPLRPTTRTFDEPMRFMASWPSTYLGRSG
jgi:hypothetical protein